MKLSPTLLPGDAAALLEAELPLLDAIERAATPEDREAALAQTRAWLVQTAAALRQQDPRSVPKTAPAPSTKGPEMARALAGLPAKKPCGCDEKTAASTLGERLARAALERFFGKGASP